MGLVRQPDWLSHKSCSFSAYGLKNCCFQGSFSETEVSEKHIVLRDRDFTDLQYKILIESLIMDREVYGLQFLL